MTRIRPSLTVIHAARIAHLRGFKLRWRRPAAAPAAAAPGKSPKSTPEKK